LRGVFLTPVDVCPHSQFIDNHDTGSTLNHWPFPSHHLEEGYAYILTHPGTPCVFYDHLYQEGGLRQVRGGCTVGPHASWMVR
jgi:hypothetical protein